MRPESSTHHESVNPGNHRELGDPSNDPCVAHSVGSAHVAHERLDVFDRTLDVEKDRPVPPVRDGTDDPVTVGAGGHAGAVPHPLDDSLRDEPPVHDGAHTRAIRRPTKSVRVAPANPA